MTDPRDMVGNNPTGQVRRSSGRKRRQAARKMDRDLAGTDWSESDVSDQATDHRDAR
jgi:hypothetical protein